MSAGDLDECAYDSAGPLIVAVLRSPFTAGSLKLTGANSLEVAGCVMSVFCKRQTWTRVK